MKVTIATVAAGLAAMTAVSASSDMEKRAYPIAGGDVTVLQYALTLEHLEAFFYKQALAKFSKQAFAKAGYPAFVRQRIEQVASQEATHVSFLSAGLRAAGVTPTAPCSYKFPYKTVDEFLALSRTLEGVGVSAYLGAAPYITLEDYLTAAGSILTVEARHQAVVSEFQGESGFPAPFDTPLGFSNVYTLAAQFITSCPKTNPTLPVTAFPSLTYSGKLYPGKPIQFQFKNKNNSSGQVYAHFLNGLTDTVVPVNSKQVAIKPKGLSGRVYIVISTSKDELTDANTVAGPAILDISDPDVKSSPWSDKGGKKNYHH